MCSTTHLHVCEDSLCVDVSLRVFKMSRLCMLLKTHTHIRQYRNNVSVCAWLYICVYIYMMYSYILAHTLIYLSVRLSVDLFVYLSPGLRLSAGMIVCLPICLSTYLFVVLSVCLAFLYVCMHVCMYARAHICYSCVLILMWWPNRRHLRRMCLLQWADICNTYPVKTKTKHTKSRGFCHNTLPCARLNQWKNKSKELTKKETWKGYVCREMFTCARLASWKPQIETRHKSE